MRGGLGLAFLPASVAADLAAGLTVIEVGDHSFSWVISVVTPAGRRLSGAARAFLSELPGSEPGPAR